MPHTSSAKKHLRKSTKQRLSNRAAKKTIKLQVRKITEAEKDAPMEQLQTDLKLAIKKLDKAAARRVIHPNTAARRKSQLARMMNERAKAGK